ncbi:MAG: hypothetical protein FJ388_14325, partial [Verrucomicrobia bacterium]|nr:hypothetical protein [Verrucomicrobiota bacterium]
MIATLQKADAAFADKDAACRRLAAIGTKEAVPALAALLTDEKLSDMARYGLEPIPDPSVDDALRGALGKVKGRTLIGVINSIGVRRDAKAAGDLTIMIGDADASVGAAAAAALGRIGDAASAKALEQSLANAPAAVRPAVADACVWCAQSLQAKGKRDQALALYDRVRKSDAPRQIVAAATRGAILARQSAGVPMLIEQIKSSDKAMASMALGLAREMSGTKVTQALVAELKKLPAERRILLMQTIADRRDAAALPAIVENAKSGDSPARVAAIRALGQIGDASVVPVLFEATADADAEVADAAKTTLTTLPGKKVDAAIVTVADKGDAKVRRLAIEIAGQRRIVAAREAFFKAADDSDKALRLAAIQALSEVGSACDVAGLIAVLMNRKDPQELAATEQALGAVCGRSFNKPTCANTMLAALPKSEGATKCALLRVLRVAGGAKAMEAVRAATKDSNADIQEAAFRSLCDWPTADAAPDLLALAKGSADAKRKILALRGYINLIKDKDLAPAKKLAMAKEANALIQRPDEKRLLLGALGSVPSAEALVMVLPQLDDAATKSEAVL